MRLTFTPEAAAFLGAKGADQVTISMLVFSSCCSGPLPPEVKPGPPADPDGFAVHQSEGFTIYYDSLLDELPEVIIGCKDFGSYQELYVQGWE